MINLNFFLFYSLIIAIFYKFNLILKGFFIEKIFVWNLIKKKWQFSRGGWVECWIMYIPCSNENSPARLSVRVLEARNLPIMDKSNDTTDAFVEVFLGSQVILFSHIENCKICYKFPLHFAKYFIFFHL